MKLRYAMLAFVALAIGIPGIAPSQTRPDPTPIRGGLNLGLPTTTWEANARDTTLTVDAWQKVDLIAITQPTTADSLRFWSTSATDSTKVLIRGVDNSGNVVSIVVTTNGTDTAFVGTYKWSKVIGAFCDTASAGTLTFKAKTGTSNLFTIPAGQIQTYTGEMWFGTTGGTVTELSIFPEAFSPMVEYELRLYRHQGNAISAPTTGYSTLWRGYTSGPSVVRPQINKGLATTNNDTSRTLFLTSPSTAFNFAFVTNSVGTTSTAYYYRSSPDASVWSIIQAIDSLDVTSAGVTNSLRYKAITLNSGSGPYFQFITNCKEGAASAGTVTTHLFPATWDTTPDPLVMHMDEACPALSYVSLYVKPYGTNGRVTVKIKGTITR